MSDADAARIVVPGPGELDDRLKALDPTQRKILGSLVMTMIRHHDKVRDREWFAQQFTAAVALTTELDDVGSTAEGMERIQTYAREQFAPLGGVAYGLFTRVAEEMQERATFTFDDAAACVMDHLGEAPDAT